jgi:hypothetical protein
MLKVSNLVGFNSANVVSGGGGTGIAVSLEDNGALSSLPLTVSMGGAAADRLIVIAYMDVQASSGSAPSDTTLTLGGSAMTRVSTIISGLSGSPQLDGYKCTFYYRAVAAGTTATLSRSGGSAHGAFALFRMTGQTSSVPAHTDGQGTTVSPVSSLSKTIAIPANGALIAAAYALTSSNHTYAGAGRVLNGNMSAATFQTIAVDASHAVTVTRTGSGGLFFIVGTWG